jgi:hypothetical protein
MTRISIGARLIDPHLEDLPLTAWAGRVMKAETLEKQLDIPGEALARWTADRDVIVLGDDEAVRLYPIEQFEKGRPVAGVRSVLATIGQPRVAWQWLRTPRPALGEPAPLELLRAGKLDRVVLLAKRDFG